MLGSCHSVLDQGKARNGDSFKKGGMVMGFQGFGRKGFIFIQVRCLLHSHSSSQLLAGFETGCTLSHLMASALGVPFSWNVLAPRAAWLPPIAPCLGSKVTSENFLR